MNERRYWIKTFLLAFLWSPLIVSAGSALSSLVLSFTVPLYNHFDVAGILLPGLCVGGCFLVRTWSRYVKRNDLPGDFVSRYLPILVSFAYYMLVWIVVFGTTEFRSPGDTLQSRPLVFLTFSYVVFTLLLSGTEEIVWLPYLQIVLHGLIAATVFAKSSPCPENPAGRRERVAIAVCCAVLLATVSFQTYWHHASIRANVLGSDYKTERVGDDGEVPWSLFLPFGEHNRLRSLDEKPTLIFTSDYPRVDGATLLFPLYGAAVETLYKGLDDKTVLAYIKFSRTTDAYRRLTSGETDVFFGLQPSQGQIEAAAQRGVKFTLTPIAKDTFVFFVNKENPVDNLTLDQIRKIYLKKIVRWDAVGGKSEKILPFQRQEDSGSQTIMTALVMEGTPLPPPLVEERVRLMGRVIWEVAGYRNHASAIGYSFRYYATGMKPNDNIKLLAIDGVAPTPENIRNGTYPFVVDLCAVTTGNESENVRALIDWCLSEQGQRLVERCGYVGLQKNTRSSIYFDKPGNDIDNF